MQTASAGRRFGELRGEAGPAPAITRRDEEQQLVDEVGLEERGRERRAALEQQRLDALVGERAQLVLERAAAQLELRPGGSGPRPNASRRGWRAASTSRASSRGASARTVPIPTATASTLRAQLVHAPPRLLAGDPAAAGHRDAAVERDARA